MNKLLLCSLFLILVATAVSAHTNCIARCAKQLKGRMSTSAVFASCKQKCLPSSLEDNVSASALIAGDILMATENVNIRNKPCTTGSTVIGSLRKYNQATYGGKSATGCGYTWHQLTTGGWVAGDFVTRIDPPKPDESMSHIYGNTTKQHYVAGLFDETTHPLFQEATSMGVCIDNTYTQYLRKDTGAALVAMAAAFNREHPSIRFCVISSTRNFDRQRVIWNNKWNGEYSKYASPVERALAILQWSSMPGTSRHHWGTDVDIYSLSDKDFADGTPGGVLYKWMVQNASKFGFYQSFTAGRCAGYNEEKWHWSYAPVSRILLRDWMESFEDICEFMKIAKFDGAEKAGILAPVYVKTVNKDLW